MANIKKQRRRVPDEQRAFRAHRGKPIAQLEHSDIHGGYGLPVHVVCHPDRYGA
jgi:hypothetical protein